MKPREVTQVAVVAAWTAGLILVLAGEPVTAAVAVFVSVTAMTLVCARWNLPQRAWKRTRLCARHAWQARRLIRRRPQETVSQPQPGGVLERAA